MSKYTYEQKLVSVLNVVEKGMSIYASAKSLGMGASSVRTWVRLYEQFGLKGLSIKHGTYSGDFKVNAVEYMHNNHMSAAEAAPKLGIPHHPQLLNWERIYNQEGPQALFEKSCGKATDMAEKRNEFLPQNWDDKTKDDLIEEVQQLRMENEYLKKLNALVQERIALENQKK